MSTSTRFVKSCTEVGLGRWLRGALVVGLLLIGGIWLVGCPAGSPGVTSGGAQDIAYARAEIERGRIPAPESITVEGFISEHSVELGAPEEPGLLFVGATVALNGDYQVFSDLATVVLGIGTTLDLENFERRALNLCLVIDRSGSMNEPIDSITRTPKLTAVQASVDRLLAQLDANDRVSIVVFNESSQTVLEAAAGDNIMDIKDAIDDLTAEGNTNIAAALQRGYRLLRDYHSDERDDRVLLFTDAEVTRGTSEADDFLEMMGRYADDPIGTTIFGVGIDFEDELAYDISQVQGGNYYYLGDYERIITIFDEEFDYLVTPVAYDVDLRIAVPYTYDVHDIYGLPNADDNSHVLELNVPTLFLSSREGGGLIFIRLRPGALAETEPEEETTLATIEMTYRPADGPTTTTTTTAVLPAGLDPTFVENYFETDGTKRAVLLLNTALTLRNACSDVYFSDYWGSYTNYTYADRAVQRLEEFLPYFDDLAEGLDDQASEQSRSLSQERALVEQLLANFQDLLD